jgi:hypothetical protein
MSVHSPRTASHRKADISKKKERKKSMVEIIVAALAFLGTVIGSLAGILVSSKLTTYRIQQLEDKVSAHNRFATRIPVLESRLEELGHRIDRIEQEPRN